MLVMVKAERQVTSADMKRSRLVGRISVPLIDSGWANANGLAPPRYNGVRSPKYDLAFKSACIMNIERVFEAILHGEHEAACCRIGGPTGRNINIAGGAALQIPISNGQHLRSRECNVICQSITKCLG